MNEKTGPAGARELYVALQLAQRGYEPAARMQALLDGVASLIGVVSDTLEEADAMIDGIPADIKGAVRLNWAYTRQARAELAAWRQKPS